jgi:hypothetical protein
VTGPSDTLGRPELVKSWNKSTWKPQNNDLFNNKIHAIKNFLLSPSVANFIGKIPCYNKTPAEKKKIFGPFRFVKLKARFQCRPYQTHPLYALRMAIVGPAVRPIQVWPPAGRGLVWLGKALETLSKFSPNFDSFGITAPHSFGQIILTREALPSGSPELIPLSASPMKASPSHSSGTFRVRH